MQGQVSELSDSEEGRFGSEPLEERKADQDRTGCRDCLARVLAQHRVTPRSGCQKFAGAPAWEDLNQPAPDTIPSNEPNTGSTKLPFTHDAGTRCAR
jgi:hypothetical protein